MAANEPSSRGITLFPDEGIGRPIEYFQPDGTEIATEELSEVQRFGNIVTQLEKRRQKSKSASVHNASSGGSALKRAKREADATATSTTNDDDDATSVGTSGDTEAFDDSEAAIDPRAHYRPMVVELQAAVVELYQLVNTVDLVRPSKAPSKEPRFLEDVHCLRDDSHLKVTTEDLAYLLTSKSSQVNDAADILLNGSKSLQTAIKKERQFFTGVRNLLGKWKICAPMHGTIPKPFRAGEGLAIDCSYVSGARITLENEATSSCGAYVLPRHRAKPTEQTLDEFGEHTSSTLLDDANSVLLTDIQHSIFCEEAFQTIMTEALLPSARWVDSAHHLANYEANTASSTPHNAPISVVCIKDDQVRVRIDESHILTVSLVESEEEERAEDTSRDGPAVKRLLQDACMYGMGLLQHQLRAFHGVCKSHSHRPAAAKQTPRILQALVTVLSHNLLVAQLTDFLDRLSATLAGGPATNHVVRLLDDCACQPVCDTVRGIFVLARWKICPRQASLSSFDLHIGKNFVTEITVIGTRIQYVDLSLNLRQVCGGVDGFRDLVCSMLSKHIAECLYEDALALGMKKASMDNDHMTVRILAPGEWDGSFVGEGKVPDEATVGCIVSATGHVNLSCVVQAIDVSAIQAHVIADTTDAAIDWTSLPGHSDAARLLWLLRSVGVITDSLK
ncbi:hypothetical protein DYB36_000652 [Aphanomyces astaci]|uniref:Mediator complex subunit 17 n=2 Tax=Aphanomyces astaci TaxID=112090 RepID=A0A397ARR6_APHAT|nr:hypothetical protein DYB36_000652 [Aphanomyces astaci]